MKKLVIVAFVLAAVGLVTATVYASGGPVATQPRFLEDGRIAIDKPTTITNPGSYVVTRNIEVPGGGGIAIRIETDDVDLDLGGFSIEGSFTPINAIGDRIKIHNGFVKNGNEETVGVTGNDFVIRDLTLQSTDDGDLFVSGNNGIIENVVVAPGSSNPGISVSGHGIVIRNNVVRGKNFGISVCGGSNHIHRNTVSDCETGISVLCGSFNVVEGNVTTANTGFGVFLSTDSAGTVYRGNTARGNGGTGCTGTASGGDFCDHGTNNTSHGDNYMPGQM